MKKVPFAELTTQKLRVTHEDDPLADFPLLKLRDFHMASTYSLLSTLNEARGTAKEHGNVDALTASLKRGWDPSQWPFPYINIDGRFELIDRRHTKAAAHALLINSVPAAEYCLAKCDEWDFLSPSAVCILAAIRFNVNGTTNATKDHFVHAILTVCKLDELDNTDIKLVRGLLDLAGVNERYSYQGTISAIENKIMDWSEDDDGPISMTKNCTDEDYSKVLDNYTQFGDNQTDKDGTLLFSMVADRRFNKRYAWDLLRHIWEAEQAGKTVRILIRSKSTTARGVREDRDDLLQRVVEYCNLAYNSYRGFATEAMNASMPSFFGGQIELPRKGIENLPGEVYLLHQLDDEDEPSLVDFLDYYGKAV